MKSILFATSLAAAMAFAVAVNASTVRIGAVDISAERITSGSDATFDQRSSSSLRWLTPTPETFSETESGVATSPFKNIEADRPFFAVDDTKSVNEATLAFNEDRESIQLLWGSVDSYNRVIFNIGGEETEITGRDIGGALGATLREIPENQEPGTFPQQHFGDALVEFRFDGRAGDTMTFTNARELPSFEFALRENPAPIPLPAAGWLLLTAVGGLGLAGYRRRKAAAAA